MGEDFCLCLTNDPTDHFTILELQISSIGKIPDRPFYHFIGQNSWVEASELRKVRLSAEFKASKQWKKSVGMWALLKTLDCWN